VKTCPATANRETPLTADADVVAYARQVLATEQTALGAVSERLDQDFVQAVRKIHACAGSVMVTGVGKAGIVGNKIAATMASVGTRAHWIHPTDALHGDLGRISKEDILLALSFSGETDELLRIIDPVKVLGVTIVAITKHRTNSLGRYADHVLALGDIVEACPMGLAPTASTTAMLALGDALALTAAALMGFGPDDYKQLHPAGMLGARLTLTVEQVMRRPDQLRVTDQNKTVRQVLSGVRMPRRRTGAVILTDGDGRLAGLFTDSDLARLLEQGQDDALDRPVREVMTVKPTTVRPEKLASEAVHLMSERKFSELPVVDEAGRPVGLVDITDLIGMGFASDDG
jgi:arabinose-5-phosphate isomerase